MIICPKFLNKKYILKILEAIKIGEEITGIELDWSYEDQNRSGDHIWWVSDIRKFQNNFHDLKLKYNIKDIIKDIIESMDL